MDQNQCTTLLRHRDEAHQQDNNHSDTTSTISEVTTPTTQPMAPTPNPPQANPGSLIHQQMLSNACTTASTSNHSPDGEISINGQFYAPMGRSANEAVHYSIANIGHNLGALVDGGANGGLAGADVCVLETEPHVQVDISGITEDTMELLPIVQCAALVNTVDKGKIILIMSEYEKMRHW